EDEDEEAARPDDEPAPMAGSSWESLAVESSFYKSLAATAGYRSWDECWDALFESPERFSHYDAFRAELAYFCAAVRATTPPERLSADGTLLREACMLRTISETLAVAKVSRDKAMVVCGGFHLFMPREPGPERALPKGTVYRTVTPYSYLRTSDLS